MARAHEGCGGIPRLGRPEVRKALLDYFETTSTAMGQPADSALAAWPLAESTPSRRSIRLSRCGRLRLDRSTGMVGPGSSSSSQARVLKPWRGARRPEARDLRRSGSRPVKRHHSLVDLQKRPFCMTSIRSRAASTKSAGAAAMPSTRMWAMSFESAAIAQNVSLATALNSPLRRSAWRWDELEEVAHQQQRQPPRDLRVAGSRLDGEVGDVLGAGAEDRRHAGLVEMPAVSEQVIAASTDRSGRHSSARMARRRYSFIVADANVGRIG